MLKMVISDEFGVESGVDSPLCQVLGREPSPRNKLYNAFLEGKELSSSLGH